MYCIVCFDLFFVFQAAKATNDARVVVASVINSKDGNCFSSLVVVENFRHLGC